MQSAVVVLFYNLSKQQSCLSVTSVDIEMSFSACKLIVGEKRHNFNPNYLEIILAIYI
jgi:hypothetical protein